MALTAETTAVSAAGPAARWLERIHRSATARFVDGTATLGRGVILGAKVIAFSFGDAVRLRLPIAEFLQQAWMLLKVTYIPAVLMAIPFGAMVSVQVSGIMNQVGASSLIGAASGVGVIRQGAPITAGLLLGGAAASAIASDLGARTIREEIDAMRVMGVDPIRRLVIPRFLGLVVIAPVLCVIIISAGVLASFLLAVMVNGVTPGSFWNSFGAFAHVVDIWFAIGKTVVFAMMIAVIASLRGMEAKGGPRGVADAVNSSVVLGVVSIVIANLAITQFQAMFFPMEVS